MRPACWGSCAGAALMAYHRLSRPAVPAAIAPATRGGIGAPAAAAPVRPGAMSCALASGGLVRGLRLAGFVALALLQTCTAAACGANMPAKTCGLWRQLPMAARAVSILSARALAFYARRAGCCRGWQTAAHRRTPGARAGCAVCAGRACSCCALGDLLLALGQLGLEPGAGLDRRRRVV